MGLDGLNGFGFVYENAGYTSPYASTGFTAPEGYKTSVDELQTELTGKKKKAGKPKKAVKPKKASVPRPKVDYNGKVTYKGLTYNNVEEFNRAYPEIKVPKAIASRVKTPPVVTPAPPKYSEYLMEKINGGKQPTPFTPPFSQPPVVDNVAQDMPKVTAEKIRTGQHKGKFGVFVNGKLQEGKVFDTEAAASDASKNYKNILSDPAKRAALTEADATEAWLKREYRAYTRNQAGLDALMADAAAESRIASKPQVVNIGQPVSTVDELISELSSTPEGTGVPGAVEESGRVVAEDAGAEAEALGRVAAEDAGAGARAGAEAGAGVKGATGAGSKGFLRQHGGKMLFAGLLLAGVATLLNLSKCEGDKKQQLPPANPEPEKKPEPKPQPEKPAQPAQPVQPAQPEQNQEQQPENTQIQAAKGSSEWGYAELELIAEHLGQAGYRPTNQEITDRMMQIIERENKILEDAKADDPEGKNRHSIPTLNEGDMLNVSPELKKLIDEATNELKEAHKDNPNYKVTWTELRAKVQEKLAA